MDIKTATPGLLFNLQSADVLRGLNFTSGRDAPQSDPTRYALFGANEDLAWDDAGWSSLASGATGLTEARLSTSHVSFANSASYRYYKLVYTEQRATMASATASPGAITPNGEGVDRAIDGRSDSKYLNRNKVDAGLLVTLSDSAVVDTLTLTTGNDASDRDPMRYVLLGSPLMAVEQLRLAQRAGDTDFYTASVIDARLRELEPEARREIEDSRQGMR
jgi:hypothetical protein